MFHVEHSGLQNLFRSVLAEWPADEERYRLCDSGILIAGRHSQACVADTLCSHLRAPAKESHLPRGARYARPTQKFTKTSERSGGDHISKVRFTNFIESLSATPGHRPTRVCVNNLGQKRTLLLIDSINATFIAGIRILSARPGNPAPAPTSASRQFFHRYCTGREHRLSEVPRHY